MSNTARVSRPLLALTMGDPCGVGPELTAMAWQYAVSVQPAGTEPLAPFVLFGDPKVLAQRAAAVGINLKVETVSNPRAGLDVFAEALPVVPTVLSGPCVAGQADPSHSGAVLKSIDLAVMAAMAGQVDGVVTNPISKSVLYAGGFKQPGHTEYLAELANRHLPGQTFEPVMMLACDGLRVVPLTIHIPLRAVPGSITAALLRSTIRTLQQALVRDFGLAEPRIAVAGLNPHAGEAGTIGLEEKDVIAPALLKLRAEGFDVRGPLSADTMFHSAARETYEAAVCMYHDQALIPIKTLAFDRGVNVTLGLPFIRTSPDHGTAFDIAGQGTASPNSLIEALRLAQRMAQNTAQNLGQNRGQQANQARA